MTELMKTKAQLLAEQDRLLARLIKEFEDIGSGRTKIKLPEER